MAERYSPEKTAEALVDTTKFIIGSALMAFGLIFMFVTAPLRRE